VSELFENEVEEIKQICNLIINFVVSNNKNVQITQYYLKLNDKNFLQIIEDTFNDSTLDGNQRKEYIELLKTFLEKLQSFYFRFSLSDDPELVEMVLFLKNAVKNFGFSGDTDNDLFSQLENAINRIDKKEIAL
jgi:hypothetical protein